MQHKRGGRGKEKKEYQEKCTNLLVWSMLSFPTGKILEVF